MQEILSKLSHTNISFILREISSITFVNDEETIGELSKALVLHALKKPPLIKAIAQISSKLPTTVAPHLNNSLMKKHLKDFIRISFIECTDETGNALSQLVKEFHNVGIYDRFDIILLLENLANNLSDDKSSFVSAIKLTNEMKDVISTKKLSKNMQTKLKRIGESLAGFKKNETYLKHKTEIELALKVIRGEYKPQLNTPGSINSIDNVESDVEEDKAEEVRESDQLQVGSLVLK